MISADLVRLVSQGSMAVLLISGVAQVWHLVILQIVSGAASACYIPAVTGIQAETVPGERLRDANAMRGMVIAVTGVLGPALGGTLATLIDPAYVLGLDAFTFAASALLVWRMRTGWKPAVGRRGVQRDLREGWTHFSSRRWLWTVTAQSAVVRAFAIAPIAVLGPVIAEKFLDGP
ncbi:MFS transporter [Salinispora oceanensis]|uniref:MFS transporter n=1 Tax=Salinispora oceanensis TaxID=1050199 RepID=UPI0003688496|nr:MFS transporter [Salinispora oceanensis]